MEYNLTKDSVNFCETLYDSGSEQSIEAQINLPEYCRDVERILKCLVIPNIFACRITGDRVTADGEALIRVIYVSDQGTTECCEQAVPFSKYIEVRDLNNECCASASATSEYVNCRAVSPRRLSVDGNVNVRFVISSMSGIGIAVSAEGCGVQTKNESVKADIPVASCRKMFEMGETAAIEQNKPSISSIIRSDAFVETESVKCIANKMLIKGEIAVDFLYKADDGSDSLICLRHTMPISQIVEVVGVTEDSICDCVVTVSSINTEAKTDSNGENRLIDISIKALISVDAYENKDITIITDGYSTEYEIKCESKSIELLKHLHTYSETKTVRETVDASSLNIAEIADISCRKSEGTAMNDGDIIKGKASAVLGILYKDNSGAYSYAERTVDFSFECQGKQGENRIIATPSLSVREISGTTVGGDKIEIKLGMNIYMPILECVPLRACTDIEPDESKPKSQNTSTLTVYFASPGESLWNIARSYNTTVGAIKEENELTQDTVGEKMMLMIPKA